MSLLVTGSIAIDTVETPTGRRDGMIGGSAIYFAYAASFFTPVRLVGVVGEDCPKHYFDIFKDRDVDMIVGNGYCPGHAAATLELVGADPILRAIFVERYGGLSAAC